MKIGIEIFAKSHKKTSGFDVVKSSLEKLAKAQEDQVKKEKPHKVYLNVCGSEVYVNAAPVATLGKIESLKEKAARFDALARRVRENRALQFGFINQFEEDDGEEDDGSIDDVPDIDMFGEEIQRPANDPVPDVVVPAEKPAAGDAARPAVEPEPKASDEPID